LGGVGLGLAAKELAFPEAELGAELLDFGLELGDTGAGPLVPAFPVAGLLAEFQIIGEQRAQVAL
jgi:hypothetical protein